MKALLVVPDYKTGTELTVPRTMALLGAILRENKHSIKIYDANIMKNFSSVLRRYRPDVVCISCTTADINGGLSFASNVKKYDKKIPVVFGGIHATVLYKNLVREKDVDVVVRGEAENIISHLFNNLNKNTISNVHGISYRVGGKVKHNPPTELIDDIDKLPQPAYDLLSLEKYERAYIMTSRGCPGRCTFCGSHSIFGYKTRYRSPKNVVDEVETLKNSGFDDIWFTDDTFTLDKKRVHEICDEMIKRKLNMKWICMSRVNAVDREVLSKMKKAGCIRTNFGIESGDENVIKIIKKGIKIKDVIKAFDIAKSVGLETTAYLMVGLPCETWDSIKKTNELIKKIKPTITVVSVLVPYPDTEIYMDMKRDGIIKDDNQNWADFKIYTESDIASPFVLSLDEKKSGLSKEEIIKAYELLHRTGEKISISYIIKSQKNVLNALLRTRSLKVIKRYITRMATVIEKK